MTTKKEEYPSGCVLARGCSTSMITHCSRTLRNHAFTIVPKLYPSLLLSTLEIKTAFLYGPRILQRAALYNRKKTELRADADVFEQCIFCLVDSR